MQEKLEHYVNNVIKYHQEAFVALKRQADYFQDHKPANQQSTTLAIRLSQEMIGHYYKAKEGIEMAKYLGFEIVQDESFYEETKQLDDVFLETLFVTKDKKIMVEEDKTFLEYYEYLNSYQNEVDKNKTK